MWVRFCNYSILSPTLAINTSFIDWIGQKLAWGLGLLILSLKKIISGFCFARGWFHFFSCWFVFGRDLVGFCWIFFVGFVCCCMNLSVRSWFEGFEGVLVRGMDSLNWDQELNLVFLFGFYKWVGFDFVFLKDAFDILLKILWVLFVVLWNLSD